MAKVLISGASRGLGYELALKHAARGDEVHLIVRRVTERVEALAAQYPSAHAHVGDVSSGRALSPALDSIRSMVREPFSILYNVAAILPEADLCGLDSLDIDIIPEVVNVNACGPLRVLQGLRALIGEMTRVINVSSESGSIANCTETSKYAYNMSKAALNLATKIYWNETGARVIDVCPGWMRTDMGGPAAWLDPAFSADELVKLADGMDELPANELFFKYDGRVLPW